MIEERRFGKNNEAKRKLNVIVVIVWEGRNIERRKEYSYFQDNRLSSTSPFRNTEYFFFYMKQSLKKTLIVLPQNYEILATVTHLIQTNKSVY